MSSLTSGRGAAFAVATAAVPVSSAASVPVSRPRRFGVVMVSGRVRPVSRAVVCSRSALGMLRFPLFRVRSGEASQPLHLTDITYAVYADGVNVSYHVVDVSYVECIR